MAKKLKEYRVNIDMVWAVSIKVNAKTKSEAKKKAWNKFKKRPPTKDFRIEID